MAVYTCIYVFFLFSRSLSSSLVTYSLVAPYPGYSCLPRAGNTLQLMKGALHASRCCTAAAAAGHALTARGSASQAAAATDSIQWGRRTTEAVHAVSNTHTAM